MKALSFRIRYVLLIGLLSLLAGAVAPIVPSDVMAQTRRDERAASEQAIYISELESEGRFSRIYNLMHSDSKAVSPREAVVGWYETDFAPLEPQSITEILDVRFIRWTWDVTGERYRNTAEVDFIQPFGSGYNVSYVEETVRLVEEDGEWHWFFGRSQEFVEEQIVRFVDDESAVRGSSREDDSDRSTSRDDGLPGSARDCTLVELYPGYPGYRGNITGVMPHWGGIGDYACLEQLEEFDSIFDREDEDRANQRAARSLGIRGSFEDWTWENWMLIEVERGFHASCYTCLMTNTSESPLNLDVRPAIDDPRILTGFIGQRVAVDSISTELFGWIPPSSSIHVDDYILRAESYFQLGATANAPELLEGMIDFVYSASQPGQGIYTYQDCVKIIFERGGYARVNGNMSPSDQQFVAFYALYVSTIGMPTTMSDPLIEKFLSVLDGWRLSGSQGSLRAYLEENWQP